MRSHPTLVYTVSRVLLFLAVLGVLFLLGARDLVLFVLAFLISGAISLVLLSRQRDAMSSSVTGTFRRINERIEASTRVEDDEADDGDAADTAAADADDGDAAGTAAAAADDGDTGDTGDSDPESDASPGKGGPPEEAGPTAR